MLGRVFSEVHEAFSHLWTYHISSMAKVLESFDPDNTSLLN
jgi:hypothetical protein